MNAVSSAPSSIVTIDPVRILDTRDPANVGLAGPFVSPVSQKLQVTGSVPTTTGTRTVVPSGATGVLLNVTVVRPTANGFVSVRPGDATGAPSTSSLNFEAGKTVPNSVQVGLPTTGANAGRIDITYDALGAAGPTTEVLIDVVGYLTVAAPDGALLARIDALEAAADALVAGDAALGADIAALVAGEAALGADIAALGAAQPFAVTNTAGTQFSLPDPPVSVLAVTVAAPVDGQVTVNYSAYVFHSAAGGDVLCAPFRSTQIPPLNILLSMEGVSSFETGENAVSNNGSVSGTRLFDIGAGETITYALACEEVGQNGFVLGRAITAIFTPAP